MLSTREPRRAIRGNLIHKAGRDYSPVRPAATEPNMAALPNPRSPTVEAIYSFWESKPDRLSRRLGASQIGRECERELWYAFRWCGTGAKFDGRMLRLFNRGHREEDVFVEELRGIGCDVRDRDKSTGEQFTFTGVGGHLVAKIDGVVLKLPEAPKTWHDLSCKTINLKGHTALVKDGLAKAKPEHVDQVQMEMHLSKLDRALYLSVCKDNDELYAERVRYDAAHGARLEAKAERVVYAPEPLPGISADPAFYKCKMCSFASTCHGTALPKASCRTCLHATPEPDGDGRWSCAVWKADIPLDAQAAGCDKHLFVPALLGKWGAVEDASEQEGWVAYRASDGFTFRNGPWGVASFTSKELHAMTPELLRHPEMQALRISHAGKWTTETGGLEPMEKAA